MSRIFSFCLLIISSPFFSSAQPNFYQDIEPIVRKNCASCHRPDQSAPFSLITYEDVAEKADFILHLVKTRYMPPWKADPGFQTYVNERILSDSVIEMIEQWVQAGMPKGKKTRGGRSSKAPVEVKPDLTLKMPRPFRLANTQNDDYRFFNIPTNLTEDKYITRIEFIPGNKKLVHHSRLMTDTSHRVREIDGLSANDPRVNAFEKYPPLDKFLYGWVPGNFPINFPAGTGKKIHKDTDIILNIHYSPTSKADQSDQSTINFYFAKDTISREVYSLAIAEDNISNPPFLIRANERKTFYSSFGPIPLDISAIAVLPHMHNLGKTFKAFAVTPTGDAIHLIKINDWDFRWQDTYQFKKLLHIPKGSTILIEATFDNTLGNPANPSTPPRDVSYGWDTRSEMMDLVIYYLLYQPGDDNFTYDVQSADY